MPVKYINPCPAEGFYTRVNGHLYDVMSMMITKLYLEVTDLIVQSDGAACFQNKAMMVLFPVITAAHGLRLVERLFNEPGDGKDVCDRMGALMRNRLDQYVDNGGNILDTADLLYHMVRDNGGVAGTVTVGAYIYGVGADADYDLTAVLNSKELKKLKGNMAKMSSTGL
jgi:hypothetical protein